MKRNVLFIIIILLFIFSFSLNILGAEVHRISPGESLFIISRNYGVTINEIIEHNNLKNPFNLMPNQVLIIPEKTIYYVEPGDTLNEIAENLNLAPELLIEKNQLENPDYIFPGQALKLPQIQEKEMLSTSVKQYQVQPGDTLYHISQNFGISIDNIISLNELEEPDNLVPGTTLNIPEYSFSELRKMYPDYFFHQGDPETQQVALTFDDGPDNTYTPAILDILEEHDIPATFFYMGDRVERYPEVVDRTAREGHTIANHSWSHPELTSLNDLEVYYEIKDTEVIMEEITGLRSGLLRPPYGLISQKIIEQLKPLNYRIIQWSADSLDWRDRDVDQILINTLPDVDYGGIILFHSAAGAEYQSLQATVDVLPELIYTLQVQDYEFVTIDELLDIPAYTN